MYAPQQDVLQQAATVAQVTVVAVTALCLVLAGLMVRWARR